MRNAIYIYTVTTLLSLFTASPLFGQNQDFKRVAAFQKKLTVLVKKTSPAFLAVEGGSGVVISSDGYVLTNHHVISRRRLGEVWYLMDPEKKLIQVKLVSIDPDGDLALLQIQGAKNRPHLELAPSRSVTKGDWVVALGNPFSLSRDGRPAASLGIVSAVHLHQGNYPDAVQTDAAVNPGNSGGPLLDMSGRIVGINGKISVRFGSRINSGVGYAISADQIRRFLPLMKKGGRVYRGDLPGLNTDSTSKSTRVFRVLSDSTTAQAGFQEGDRILEVNGWDARRTSRFWGLVKSHPAGVRLNIKVQRTGGTTTLSLILPQAKSSTKRGPRGRVYLGVKLKRQGKGFEVGEVLPLSPAERGGLKSGDLIVEVDGKKFSNLKALGTYIRGKDGGDILQLKVRRGKDSLLLQIRLGRL